MLSVCPSLHLSIHQSIRPSWNIPPPQQMIFPISSERWYLQEHCVQNHISCAGWYPSTCMCTCTCTCVYWTGAYTKLWLAKSLKAVYSWRQTCKGVVTVTNGLNSRVLQMCVLQREAGGNSYSSPSKQEFTPNTDVNTRKKSWQTTRRTEKQLQLQLPPSA